MKPRITRILALLLSLVCLMGIAAVPALAASKSSPKKSSGSSKKSTQKSSGPAKLRHSDFDYKGVFEPEKVLKYKYNKETYENEPYYLYFNNYVDYVKETSLQQGNGRANYYNSAIGFGYIGNFYAVIAGTADHYDSQESGNDYTYHVQECPALNRGIQIGDTDKLVMEKFGKGTKEKVKGDIYSDGDLLILPLDLIEKFQSNQSWARISYLRDYSYEKAVSKWYGDLIAKEYRKDYIVPHKTFCFDKNGKLRFVIWWAEQYYKVDMTREYY